jgi:hypothetical protein
MLSNALEKRENHPAHIRRFSVPFIFATATLVGATIGTVTKYLLDNYVGSRIPALASEAIIAATGGVAAISIFLLAAEIIRRALNKKFTQEPFNIKIFMWFLGAGLPVFSALNFTSETLPKVLGTTGYYLLLTAIKTVAGAILGEGIRCVEPSAANLAHYFSMLNIVGLNAGTSLDFILKLIPPTLQMWLAPVLAAAITLVGAAFGKAVYEVLQAVIYAMRASRPTGEKQALLGTEAPAEAAAAPSPSFWQAACAHLFAPPATADAMERPSPPAPPQALTV